MSENNQNPGPEPDYLMIAEILEDTATAIQLGLLDEAGRYPAHGMYQQADLLREKYGEE